MLVSSRQRLLAMIDYCSVSAGPLQQPIAVMEHAVARG